MTINDMAKLKDKDVNTPVSFRRWREVLAAAFGT